MRPLAGYLLCRIPSQRNCSPLPLSRGFELAWVATEAVRRRQRIQRAPPCFGPSLDNVPETVCERRCRVPLRRVCSWPAPAGKCTGGVPGPCELILSACMPEESLACVQILDCPQTLVFGHTRQVLKNRWIRNGHHIWLSCATENPRETSPKELRRPPEKVFL